MQEKIDEVYVLCSQNLGSATFKGIAKVFWPILDNGVSLIDLASIFTISAQDGMTGLNINLFGEFFHGISRIKYPNVTNYCVKLLEELQQAKQVNVLYDNPVFNKCIDRAVTGILLTFDFPLRRAFSNYAGESVKVGGGLSWDEVKRLSVGMEIAGFIAFAGAFNIIPQSLNIQQCDLLSRKILADFPLLAGGSNMQSTLLFPQFQLLMCFVAHERQDVLNKLQALGSTNNNASTGTAPPKSNFAKKVVPTDIKPMAEMLSDLLKSLGIDKLSSAIPRDVVEDKNKQPTNKALLKAGGHDPSTNVFAGTVSLPTFDGLDNPSNSSGSKANSSLRQAMLMRIDHIFENDIANKLNTTTLASSSDLESMLRVAPMLSGEQEKRSRNLLNKPVVIGDAIPVPSNASMSTGTKTGTGSTATTTAAAHVIHDSVEQMLQAALAHHNLGNFEESLKFLEASRVQLFTIERVSLIKSKQKALERQREEELEQDDQVLNSKGSKITGEMIENVTVADSEVLLPIHLEMYIILCKGNVYQSCGDDEQALHNYILGWNRAVQAGNKEWEVVCINSIALVAYYNVRFEIALICFSKVAHYRQQAYGSDSPDTATAWNNEAACLYCINKRGEARIKFEQSWNVLCKVLGHRHPRSVAVWKNLDKARRSQAAVSSSKADMDASVKLRPDAEFLIPGNFTVNASMPDGTGGAGAKKGVKKKGGKKKK